MEFQLLSFSLLVTLLFFSFTFDAARSEVVYDTNGDSLFPGQKYYILPVIRGSGGGVTLMQHNEICPLYVGQRAKEVDKGQPVIFLPRNPKVGFVSLSTNVNIDFSGAITICMIPTGWQLGDPEGPDNKRYVIAKGSTENPGNETVNNWFQIRKWGDSSYYKLVFCPSVCDTCELVCGDVGVFIENEKRFLGLNGNPFPVMFERVDSDDQFQ